MVKTSNMKCYFLKSLRWREKTTSMSWIITTTFQIFILLKCNFVLAELELMHFQHSNSEVNVSSRNYSQSPNYLFDSFNAHPLWDQTFNNDDLVCVWKSTLSGRNTCLHRRVQLIDPRTKIKRSDWVPRLITNFSRADPFRLLFARQENIAERIFSPIFLCFLSSSP